MPSTGPSISMDSLSLALRLGETVGGSAKLLYHLVHRWKIRAEAGGMGSWKIEAGYRPAARTTSSRDRFSGTGTSHRTVSVRCRG